MSQIVINLVGFTTKSVTSGTYYDPTKYFDMPANAGITSAVLNYTVNAQSGGFTDRSFQFNATRAHPSSPWLASGVSLNAALIVTGSNAYRFTFSAGATTAFWGIGSVTLTIDYLAPTAATLSNVLLDGSAANPYRGAGAGLTLSWTSANGTDNAITSYTVWYRDNGGAWAVYASGITATSLAVAATSAGNNRQFLVQALAPYGNSEQVASPIVYSYSAPTAPTSASVTPTTVYTSNNITLAWSGAAGGVGVSISQYYLYCGTTYVGASASQSLVVQAPDTAGTYSYYVYSIGNVSGYNSGASPAAVLTVENPRSIGSLNKSGVAMDDTSTIMLTVVPSNAAYNHKAIWYTPSHSVTHNLAVGVTTDTLSPVPLAWCTAYPNAVSGTANVKLETYSGTTKIGELIYPFTITVPSTVLPTISALAIAAVDGFTGLYLKGISKVQLTATASGAQSSTISSYSMSGGGGTGTTNPWTSPILTTAGTITVSVTVIDSRGRTATRQETIAVSDYANPVISLTSAIRSLPNGTADNDGTYAKVTATLSVTSLSGNNPIASAIAEYRLRGGSLWTLGTNALVSATASVIGGGLIVITDTYEIRISLTDTVGKSSTYTMIISPSTRLYDFRNDRAGIGRVAGAATKQLVLPDDWTTNISLMSYPIGAIYQSVVSTSPATLFGGTWAALGGRMLIGVDATYLAGATGGAATHTLTTAESAFHTHRVYGRVDRYQGAGAVFRELGSAGDVSYGGTEGTGGGGAHNNMSPYLSVYMWQRTA